MSEETAGRTAQSLDIGGFVGRTVSALQDAYIGTVPSPRAQAKAVADLAKLRRGVGQPLGADLELIGLTTGGLYPEDYRLPDEPTDLEQAAYTAITLFALHQQSHRGRRMHLTKYSLGRSARLLGKHSEADEAVRRRFNALGTATAWDELVHHSRGLIQQFRAYDIPLDYSRFAIDLVRLRRPATAVNVRNAWGRDFYRVKTDDDSSATDDAPDMSAPTHDD